MNLPDPAVALDWLTKVTQFIAALTAFVLVAFAGPRELRKWRRQKLAEHKAEVAAAALVASVDLLDALESASFPMGISGDVERQEGQSHTEFMRAWFGKRLGDVNPQLVALTRIRTQAHVYLSDEQNAALDAVSSHVNGVAGSFMAWATLSEGGAGYHEEARKEHKEVFGEKPRVKRAELRERVTKLLRTSAQYRDVD